VPAGAQTPSPSATLGPGTAGKAHRSREKLALGCRARSAECCGPGKPRRGAFETGKICRSGPRLLEGPHAESEAAGGAAQSRLGGIQARALPGSGCCAQCRVGADPGNTQARTLLGLSCYGAGRFALASTYWAPVAQLEPWGQRQQRRKRCSQVRKPARPGRDHLLSENGTRMIQPAGFRSPGAWNLRESGLRCHSRSRSRRLEPIAVQELRHQRISRQLFRVPRRELQYLEPCAVQG
jgi:hypothetical protein